MTANEIVSAEVERELSQRQWTRSRLARELGVSAAWVTRKLEGERRWSVDDLDLLESVLGLHLALSHDEDESGASSVGGRLRPVAASFRGVA